MRRIFQPASASAPPQVMDPAKLRERIAEFARMFEPAQKRGPMNAVEAVAAARREGVALASNRDFDFLQEKKSSAKVWTGTLIIAQKEGRQFGEQITTSPDLYNPFSFMFVVPKELRDQVGGCIAFVHPEFDFMLVGQNTYQVVPTQGAKLHLVGKFPLVCGAYGYDTELGLCSGEKMEVKTLEQTMKERDKPKDMGDDEWKAKLKRELESSREGVRGLTTRYGAHICLAVRDLSDGRAIHISVPASERLQSFVRASITPENYVQHVTARLEQDGKNRELKRFVYDWMSVDPALAKEVNRGILSIFSGFSRV